jgi:flavin reductase (DIM6/NTAB) family NADH-FMN oxidoreductase RutF
VTIHSEHPFLPPESDRDPVRRFRGRLAGAVSLWTTGDSSASRAGLTVSSLLVAPGRPAHVLALLDPDADFTDVLKAHAVAVVQLLQWEHLQLADAFAGLAPAPGGAFRLGQWAQSEWGPVLQGAMAWVGVRVVDRPPVDVGWSVLVDTVIEHAEIGPDEAPLLHRRGRYQRLPGSPTDT